MKGNDQPLPEAPVVVGTPTNPISDAELNRWMEEHRLAVQRESKCFLALRNALAEYDLARDVMHLATIRRDARITELAEKRAK